MIYTSSIEVAVRSTGAILSNDGISNKSEEKCQREFQNAGAESRVMN